MVVILQTLEEKFVQLKLRISTVITNEFLRVVHGRQEAFNTFLSHAIVMRVFE